MSRNGSERTPRRINRAVLRVPGAVFSHPRRGALLLLPRSSWRAAAGAALVAAGLAIAIWIWKRLAGGPWRISGVAIACAAVIALFVTLRSLLRPAVLIDRSAGTVYFGSRIFRRRAPLDGLVEIRIAALDGDDHEAALVSEDGSTEIPVIAGPQSDELEAAARQIAGFLGIGCRRPGNS